MNYRKKFTVEPGAKVRLGKIDPDFTGKHISRQDGIDATARQIERIADFTRLDRGITVNPGVISGGTRTNVIAAEARAEVDRHDGRPDLDRRQPRAEQPVGAVGKQPRPREERPHALRGHRERCRGRANRRRDPPAVAARASRARAAPRGCGPGSGRPGSRPRRAPRAARRSPARPRRRSPGLPPGRPTRPRRCST